METSDKRERILAAALHLFTTRGFHDTPTSLIAKEAGVATGTLFHYFSTKEDLINALYLSCKRSLSRGIGEGVTERGEFRDTARKIFDNAVAWAVANPAVYRFFEQYSHSPYIEGSTRIQAESELSFLKDVIRQGTEIGCFKEMPVSFTMNMVWGAMTGVIGFFLEEPERFRDRELVERSFEAFWRLVGC